MPNTHNMQSFLGCQMLNAIKEKGWRNGRKKSKGQALFQRTTKFAV